jgi:hypothetical protein
MDVPKWIDLGGASHIGCSVDQIISQHFAGQLSRSFHCIYWTVAGIQID